MKLAGYLSFDESIAPIREPVTKFGGKPNWLTKPEWPVDKMGEPMMFLGQVFLDPEIFGRLKGQMAYLFFPGLDPLQAEPHWDSARNAIVIQPGEPSDLQTKPLTDGPAVCRVVKGKRKWLFFRERIALPCEFAASVTKRVEPEINWDDDDPLANTPHDLEDCKVGGETIWIQGEEWPYEDSRHLLLQLVWRKFPFCLGLGDAGTLWAFLNSDGTQGKMLWQCY